jgi:hypothetical protein
VPLAAIIAGIREGLAFRRGTTHCTKVRTSGVAHARKCLQIGVWDEIGAESLRLRLTTRPVKNSSRHMLPICAVAVQAPEGIVLQDCCSFLRY